MAADPSDLTTLANVKAFFPITNSNDDALLQRLITSLSKWFVQEVDRPIHSTAVTEIIDGSDERFRQKPAVNLWSVSPGLGLKGFALELKYYPVIGDMTLVRCVNGTEMTDIPKRTTFDSAPWLPNHAYTAGERCTNGGNTYLATGSGTSAATGGPTGEGSNIVDGAGALRWSYETPTDEGWVLLEQRRLALAGNYEFNPGVGNIILMYTAGYADSPAPSEVEQAVIEGVCWKYRERASQRQESKSAGGEVIKWSQKEMPPFTDRVIDRWRRTKVS